jgi:hypothetical protein
MNHLVWPNNANLFALAEPASLLSGSWRVLVYLKAMVSFPMRLSHLYNFYPAFEHILLDSRKSSVKERAVIMR